MYNNAGRAGEKPEMNVEFRRLERTPKKNRKNNNPIHEKRIRTLIRFSRIDEAMEYWEGLRGYTGPEIDELLIDEERYDRAIEYYHSINYPELIDELKLKVAKNSPEAVSKLADYWMEWISMIKNKHDVRTCPHCGGKLMPIMWGYPLDEHLKRAEKGEFFLGGCSILIPFDFHCTGCHRELFLGTKGLDIECEDEKLKQYIEFKIEETASVFFGYSKRGEKTFKELEGELNMCSEELEAYLNRLMNLNYIEKTSDDKYRMTDLII